MPKTSTVLTLRVKPETARRLASEARRLRRTRGEVARSLLEAALDGKSRTSLEAEARRQSLLAGRSRSDREANEFILAFADLEGWK